MGDESGGCVWGMKVWVSGPQVAAHLSRASSQAPGQRCEWWNGPNEYFVLGDSRAFGTVPADNIMGRV